MKKIINYINRIILKLKRVKRYLPVIWNSYDFDYRYATDLFKMKLEDIADFMESDKAVSANAVQDAQKVRTAIKLMQKVYDADYNTEYQTQLEELYGEGVNDFEFVDYIQDNGKLGYRIKLGYEDWDNVDEVRAKERELFDKAYIKQKKAHRILWQFIEHNIEKWWD